MCSTEPKEPRLSEYGVKSYGERSCTDILLLLVFVGSWIGAIAILTTCIEQGADVNKIIRGVDLNGSICGKSSGFEDLPLAAWLKPYEYYTIKICVSDCNETETNPLIDPPYKSEKFLYYCIPTTDINGTVDIELTGDFESVGETTSRAIGDLYTAWPSLFLAIPIALAMSFLYTYIARKCGSCMVWLVIVFLAVAGFLASYAFLMEAKDADDSVSTSRAKAMKALGYIFLAITVIYIFVVFALRKRVEIAIEVIGEASRAIEEMPSMIFFPLFPLVLGLGYFSYFVYASLTIFSVTTDSSLPIPDDLLPILAPQVNYTRYKWDDGLKDSFAYYFLHLIYNVYFLIYFTFLVIAGAIADWYFTARNSDGSRKRGSQPFELGPTPVTDSLKRTCRFHLGTISFGALIMAIVEYTRAVIKYIEEHSKAQENPVQKCFFCLVNCFMKCVVCCLDKISKNAFVWTAIFGDNFMESACSSFDLIWSNLARVAAINLVGTYLLEIGKILVSLLTVGIYASIVKGLYGDDLSSIAMPCFVVFVLSYMVASLFMVAYDTTIDTMFLCFLIDEKLHKGTGRMFAPPTLSQLVDSYSNESVAHADKMRGGVEGGYQKMN